MPGQQCDSGSKSCKIHKETENRDVRRLLYYNFHTNKYTVTRCLYAFDKGYEKNQNVT